VSAVSAPVLCVPLTGSVPDHAPEAVHVVALVEDQVIVVLPPLATMLGLGLIVTVGAWATVFGLDDVTVGDVTVGDVTVGDVTVGLVCEVVLDGAFVLVVPTSEPHADKPKANANARANSRQRVRNDNRECCRDSKYIVSIAR
jgi:hypothetical protein